jgi:glycosyltransferase involved in cell wall biosynthesis
MLSIVILTYNRLNSLKNCIDSVIKHTKSPYEIIVVNNNSNDGTKEYLDTLKNITALNLDNNYGVIARNRGFKIAKGEIIAQTDDDVIMHDGWDTTVLNCFNSDSSIGMVGVQGGLINNWMDYEVYKHNNGYVDFLTGFFIAFKNVGLIFDEVLGKFWEEDSDLSFQFKAAGHKIKLIPMVCTHVSQRTGPIDWDLHNGNRDYVRNKWEDKLDKLRLGGK